MAEADKDLQKAVPDAFTGLTVSDYVKYLLYYLIGVGLFIVGF